MTYVINKYNGQVLVTIPDRTLNTTATSIKLPGRNYPSYGEPLVEDIIYLLENFAGAVAPTNPMIGQAWFDTSVNALKLYDGISWNRAGKIFYSSSAPTDIINGQLWYNTTQEQLKIYKDGIWKVIGPMAPADNTNGVLPIPAYSTVDVCTILDSGNAPHSVIRFTLDGILVAVLSSVSFTPNSTIAGFATINKGLTLNSTYTGLNLTGKASSAYTADDTTLFKQQTVDTFMRTNNTNLPTVDNAYNLGSNSLRYSNVYATTFQGKATSAQYADVAERYQADDSINPGNIVCLGGRNEITICREQGSTDVLGVTSTNPALMMNCDAGSDISHPFVALVGRVPVKVYGPVKKGQRLMSSSLPGVAVAWQDRYGVLAIIGRALSDKSSTDIGLLEIVVGTK